MLVCTFLWKMWTSLDLILQVCSISNVKLKLKKKIVVPPKSEVQGAQGI